MASERAKNFESTMTAERAIALESSNGIERAKAP
jgi:hypothetical protein